MLKRLEREAALADLAAIESVLADRNEATDPVGWRQFSRRKEQLERELSDLTDAYSSAAGVGVFFGGRPVVGSRGVVADFGTKAIEQFQAVVSSTFAALEGRIGARGPLPQKERTQLYITDVARGSFGFILEEADSGQLVDTSLKYVVDSAVDLIYRVASPDEAAFDSATEAVDERVLGALQVFFKTLDDAGATVRLVEEQRDFTLQRDAVELARARTETLTLTEHDVTMRGTIYVLPDSRRFELHSEGGETLKGTIAPQCLQALTDGGPEVRPGVIGSVRSVALRVREIKARGRDPRKSYLLTAVDDWSISDDEGV
jgi:hypothetical protein